MEEKNEIKAPTIKAEISVEIKDLGDDKDEREVKRLFKHIRIYGLIILACFIAGAICMRTEHYKLGAYCAIAVFVCIVLICGVVGRLLGKCDGYTPGWYGGL